MTKHVLNRRTLAELTAELSTELWQRYQEAVSQLPGLAGAVAEDMSFLTVKLLIDNGYADVGQHIASELEKDLRRVKV